MMDSDTPAIEIRDLRVDYGDLIAVNDISLKVPRGQVFGIVGPNGAGKTSMFRVITTLMEPTYGEVILDGVDVLEDAETARRIIGYMPDLAPVPSDLKVGEFLEFYAAAYGIPTAAARRDRVAECLEAVALTGHRDHWCKKLSRGQTQSVVLAKTLLHRPSVLILDEPASGLDALARRDLRMALRRFAADGGTVFVSSHILGELAEMCTSLCVVDRGNILASGSVNDVLEQMGSDRRILTLAVLSDVNSAMDFLRNRDHISEVTAIHGKITLTFTGSEEAQADLFESLVSARVRITAFEERRASFEDILVDVAEAGRAKK